MGSSRPTLSGPAGQGGAVNRKALGGHHLSLPVNRQMMAAHGDHDAGERAEGGLAASDRLGGRFGLHDLLACSAAVFRAHNPRDPPLHRASRRYRSPAAASRRRRPGRRSRPLLVRSAARYGADDPAAPALGWRVRGWQTCRPEQAQPRPRSPVLPGPVPAIRSGGTASPRTGRRSGGATGQAGRAVSRSAYRAATAASSSAIRASLSREEGDHCATTLYTAGGPARSLLKAKIPAT